MDLKMAKKKQSTGDLRNLLFRSQEDMSAAAQTEVIPQSVLDAPQVKETGDLRGADMKKMSALRYAPPVDLRRLLIEGRLEDQEYHVANALQHCSTPEDREALVLFYGPDAYVSLLKCTRLLLKPAEVGKLLVLCNDLLVEDESRVVEFAQAVDWRRMLDFLDWNDRLVANVAAQIASRLVVQRKPAPADAMPLFTWLKGELHADNQYVMSIIRCLQKLLRIDKYRLYFMEISGVSKIVRLLLAPKLSSQLQYLLTFCVWVVSYNPYLAERLNRVSTIPILCNVLKACPAENRKLPRIILACFRNLLEKPREERVRRNNALVLIHNHAFQYMRMVAAKMKLEVKKDEELAEDFQVVQKLLLEHERQLSCWDAYRMELESGELEWSLVHKSKRFWQENAHKFNENKYRLLKMLIELLETAEDDIIVSIAAYDIGQYMQSSFRGRKVVEELDAKSVLVKLLGNRHPAVNYHVLRTLQILMLTNHGFMPDFEFDTVDNNASFLGRRAMASSTADSASVSSSL